MRVVRACRQTEALAIEDKVFSSIGKQARAMPDVCSYFFCVDLGSERGQVLSTIRSPPSVATTKSTREQVSRCSDADFFCSTACVLQQVESGPRCTCPRWTRLMLLADQSLTSTWSCRQRSRCDAQWQLGKMAVLDLALSLSLIGTLQRLFTDWGLSPLAKRIAELGFCSKQVFAPCFILFENVAFRPALESQDQVCR